MVCLSSAKYDPNGSVTLKEGAGSNFFSASRRMSRIPTLNGGAKLVDYGYTDADREIKIKAKVTFEELTLLRRLVSTWAEHVLSCVDGVFLGAISSIKESGGVVTIEFLPIEKVD